MRYSEIVQPKRGILATSRFVKEFIVFARGNPSIVTSLSEFFEFRCIAAPTEPYGKKDYMFSNGDLRGWRHFHVEHGSLILIYKITASALMVVALVTHKAIDGASVAISKYVAGLTMASFSPFSMPAEQPAELSAGDREGFREMFYDLASDPPGRTVLQQAAAGQFLELMKFVELVPLEGPWSDAEKSAVVIAAFGGVDGLRKLLGQILQQTQAN